MVVRVSTSWQRTKGRRLPHKQPFVLGVFADARQGVGRPQWAISADTGLILNTILLAEDDESAIELYKAMFTEHQGWRLVVARTGQEALDRVGSEHPQVALLDVQMPAMDGLEVCRRIKSNPDTASTRVIVVSALTQVTNRLAAQAAGADEFVAKPFSTNDLTSLVEQTLSARP